MGVGKTRCSVQFPCNSTAPLVSSHLFVMCLFSGSKHVPVSLTAVSLSGRYMAICDVENHVHIYHLKRQKVTNGNDLMTCCLNVWKEGHITLHESFVCEGIVILECRQL